MHNPEKNSHREDICRQTLVSLVESLAFNFGSHIDLGTIAFDKVSIE